MGDQFPYHDTSCYETGLLSEVNYIANPHHHFLHEKKKRRHAHAHSQGSAMIVGVHRKRRRQNRKQCGKKTILTPIPEDESCEFCQPTKYHSSKRINPSNRVDHSNLLAWINYERLKRSARLLQRSNFLSDLAQAHAKMMADKQQIFHSVQSVQELKDKVKSIRAGENVQSGRSINQMHIQAMGDYNSPHRDNLLSDRFNKVGIGTATDADGTVYLCLLFCEAGWNMMDVIS
jgi:uncharacterized protein YkwD